MMKLKRISKAFHRTKWISFPIVFIILLSQLVLNANCTINHEAPEPRCKILNDGRCTVEDKKQLCTSTRGHTLRPKDDHELYKFETIVKSTGKKPSERGYVEIELKCWIKDGKDCFPKNSTERDEITMYLTDGKMSDIDMIFLAQLIAAQKKKEDTFRNSAEYKAVAAELQKVLTKEEIAVQHKKLEDFRYDFLKTYKDPEFEKNRTLALENNTSTLLNTLCNSGECDSSGKCAPTVCTGNVKCQTELEDTEIILTAKDTANKIGANTSSQVSLSQLLVGILLMLYIFRNSNISRLLNLLEQFQKYLN